MTRVQGNDSRWEAWAEQTSSTGRPPAPRPEPTKTRSEGSKRIRTSARCVRWRFDQQVGGRGKPRLPPPWR